MSTHLFSRFARLGIFPGLLLTLVLSPSAQAQTPEFRGFWVDGWGSDLWTAPNISNVVKTTRAANMNALVVQARRRGDALYNSKYEPKCKDIAADFDPLGEMIAQAKNTTNGPALEVHAWMVTYHIHQGTTAPPQPTHPYNRHPDWLLKDFNGNTLIGNEYTFDPGHPAVQAHTFNVAMDIITNYPVDGLNFDYIRYSSVNEGYNDVTVARFNRLFNRTGKPATTDAVWKQFRRDQVTGLLRKVYLHAIAVRPEVKISCDTITWAPGPTNDLAYYSSSAAWNSIMQDWRGWMEEGIMDLNITMNYFRQTTHAQEYLNWLNFAKDHRFNRHFVNGPAIYLNSVSDAIAQMRMSRDLSPGGKRADGVCGYSYRVTNKDSVPRADFVNALVALSSYDTMMPPIFSTPVPTPAMPWKTASIYGHLKGFVYGNSSTNPVDGASVIISGPSPRAQTNDATGFYGFVELAPGTYTVEASAPGCLPLTNQVVVSAGAVQTLDLVLTVINAPMVTVQPKDKIAFATSNITFAVFSTGTPPLSYQWRFAGADLPDGTNAVLALNNLATNQDGLYDVIITNIYGAVTSDVARLKIYVPPPLSRLGLNWQLPPLSRPYLTVNSLPLERGLAYDKKTERLLIVSRSGPKIYVLDAPTGDDLHELSVAGVLGGTYPLLMIGAAEDGAIYAGNLTTDGSASAFRLYRWADDNLGTAPTLAYSGNPSPGNPQRWGDTLDVRGAGTNTQILIASRLGTNVVLLTTANGTTFTNRNISISGLAGGDLGLGLAFAEGNTLWGKASGRPLRQIAFDPATGTGTVLRTYGAPEIPNAVSPISYSSDFKMLAGINISSLNHLRLYEIPDAPAAPVLVTTNLFPADNDNTAAGTGAVDFGGNRLFALDSNNGLLAMAIATPPVITSGPQNLTAFEGGTALLSVQIDGTAPLTYQWWFNNSPLSGATSNTLAQTPALPAIVGSYFVVVTNIAGAVTSAPAMLAVQIPRPPSFSQFSVPVGGPVQIAGSGEPGQFLIQFSDDLVIWRELVTLVSTNGTFNYEDPDRTLPRRFYRVRWLP